jgi:hypothetical protein
VRRSILTVLALATALAVAALALNTTPVFGQADTTRPAQVAPAQPTTSTATKRKAAAKAARARRRRAEAAREHRRLWPSALRSYTLDSTAYCGDQGFPEGSITSSGEGVHDGIVAVLPDWPLGEWFQVRSGPLTGKILHGQDHLGSGSQFDIWMPSGCDAYGRHEIKVNQISQRSAEIAMAAQHH